jgi:urease accessory protein
MMELRLLQLADSALPIGGYSHSWGLEAAIDRGLVRDAEGLERWTRLWLGHVVAPFEGVVVAAVAGAVLRDDWSVVGQANELVAAGLAAPTLRQASRDMGEQLLALAEGWPWAAAQAGALRRLAATVPGSWAWHHAPVFGTLCATTGAGPANAVAVYLHQSALGCIGAGVRAVPVGHSHGQQVLARLHPDIAALAAHYTGQDLETAGSFAPAYEVLCHAQSRLYTRLFRS